MSQQVWADFCQLAQAEWPYLPSHCSEITNLDVFPIPNSIDTSLHEIRMNRRVLEPWLKDRPRSNTVRPVTDSHSSSHTTTQGEPSAALHVFPNADDLIERNAAFAATYDGSVLGVQPTRSLAVVACMDARVEVLALLGLVNGEAHIIRNAGGAVTDDAIRSLCLSQRFLGTREIVLLHHTDCGLHNLDENEFNESFERELGVRPPWALESFRDPFADVRQSMRRLHLSPFLTHTDHVRGFVYDVDTGLLHEVHDGQDEQ